MKPLRSCSGDRATSMVVLRGNRLAETTVDLETGAVYVAFPGRVAVGAERLVWCQESFDCDRVRVDRDASGKAIGVELRYLGPEDVR